MGLNLNQAQALGLFIYVNLTGKKSRFIKISSRKKKANNQNDVKSFTIKS